MAKIKKCKSTGKAKGFEGCGNPLKFSERNGIKTYNAKYGLCPSCQYKWSREDKQGKEWFEKQLELNRKKKIKEIKAKNREEKSLNLEWDKLLQKEINSIVRTIDKGLTCLARNQRGQIHAGHVYARGGNQYIRYNLHNIHRQSAQSNHHQNDDGLLREGVVREYGQEYMDFISELRRTPRLEYDNRQFRDLTTKARVILKSLIKDDKIYSKSERIEIRSRINLELGIYDAEFCEFN